MESGSSLQDQASALKKETREDPNKPLEQFTNRLLIASGTAFVTGVFGSLWYQGRKTRQRGIHRAAAAASNPSALTSRVGSSSPLNSPADNIPRRRLQSLQDVKTTEALIREGRLLGLKAFAIATALCLSGAAVIVGTTRWALDVQTIPEFSAKMRELFPKQRAKFVDAVVEADQAVFGGEGKPDKEATLSAGATADGEGGAYQEGEEVDLDHEQDSKLLSRLERDLSKWAEKDS